jgi:hypothetical protein
MIYAASTILVVCFSIFAMMVVWQSVAGLVSIWTSIKHPPPLTAEQCAQLRIERDYLEHGYTRPFRQVHPPRPQPSKESTQ